MEVLISVTASGSSPGEYYPDPDPGLH